MRGAFWTIMLLMAQLVASIASTETPITKVPQTTNATTTILYNITTEIPTTSTTTPKTTTAIPRTTTVPSTTTAVPSTTTDLPTSTQPVDEGKWNVTEGNVTCIIAEIRADFLITQGNLTLTIPLPSTAEVDSGSSCNINNTQILVLSFEDNILEFVFEKDSDSVSLRNITFVTNIQGQSMVFFNDTKLFPVKVGNSYMCRTSDKIPLSTTGKEISITLDIEEIHVQAFRSEQEDEFGAVEECSADEIINDIVPIAVACALAMLIVIVLIAYLVGRRRNQQRGYTSV